MKGLTAQKIANILWNNGFELVKQQDGYKTAGYTVYTKRPCKVVYSVIGVKQLKELFNKMNAEYTFDIELKEIPMYNLDGRYQR